MMLHKPWTILGLGFVLVLTGFVLPFLMVLRVIQPSFLLSFFSFAASVAGLFLGLIAAAMLAPRKRR